MKVVDLGDYCNTFLLDVLLLDLFSLERSPSWQRTPRT